MASPQRRALRERPWDLFYFVYFIFHILVFLFIDGQNFYPPRLVPRALGAIVDDYLTRSSDPFVLALRAGDRRYLWFTTSMWSSLVFQNPVFVAGAWCLWYDDKRVYPIMASYALLATVTTMQCLASVVWGAEGDHLSPANTSMLLSSYVPFVIIPLAMLLDMSFRSVHLIDKAVKAESNGAPSRQAEKQHRE